MKHRFAFLLCPLLAVGAHAQSRVDTVLKQLTLDEKLSFLSGTRDPRSLGQAGYLPGVPRLGIAPLRLTDGPAGVRVARRATALPAPVSLAATFSEAHARRYGQVVGREGRALEQDILLSPMVNLVRVPGGGRNFETFGEDPLLASRIVAQEVRGIQGEGLIATVKHFAANNFEQDRMSVDVRVDERTLREMYLPAFEAAIRAGAGSVMGSYNRVNGVFACENPFLLTHVLRREWGFRGFVMSDWFATHSTVDALTAGLDMEMPGPGMGNLGPPVYFGEGLRRALGEGKVAESAVDRAVRRILTSMDAVGLLGAPRPRPRFEAIAAEDARTARDLAVAGAVLLRNERGVLPLRPADLESTVVIGASARVPMIGGGGSAQVVPARAESPIDALNRRARRPIRYIPGIDLDGVPVPESALVLGGGGSVDFAGARGLEPGHHQWEGQLTAPSDGVYALKLQTVRGTARVTLDGKPLIASGLFFGGNDSLLPTSDGLKNASVAVTLKAGESHRIAIVADSGGPFPGMPAPPGKLEVRLNWVTPERRLALQRAAAAAARGARTALVFAYDEGTEGGDRSSLGLPGDQDDLIRAVAAANARTVVVLNTGSCVTMPWADRVGAILEMWFPGQEGADATTAVLLGDADPGGRLPVTFPRRAADAPTARADRYPGVGGKASYGEGIFFGYRHYDRAGVAPLFPFGHGLSYTTWSYSDLRIARVSRGARVSFTVRNAGGRSGVAVPQVYVGPAPKSEVPMAARKLVGFTRLELGPGQTRRVTIDVPTQQLSNWSVARQGWVEPTGARSVWVGSSSRASVLRGVLR